MFPTVNLFQYSPSPALRHDLQWFFLLQLLRNSPSRHVHDCFPWLTAHVFAYTLCMLIFVAERKYQKTLLLEIICSQSRHAALAEIIICHLPYSAYILCVHCYGQAHTSVYPGRQISYVQIKCKAAF